MTQMEKKEYSLPLVSKGDWFQDKSPIPSADKPVET